MRDRIRGSAVTAEASAPHSALPHAQKGMAEGVQNGNGENGFASAAAKQTNGSAHGEPNTYPVDLLRQNVYVNRLRKTCHEDLIMVCNCERPQPPPGAGALGKLDGSFACIGCGEDCENRQIFVECHPDWCPCGSLCGNQRFARRQYVDVGLMQPTGPKGFGLLTKEAIKAGDFIIEYVGEVVSEDEYLRRKIKYQDSRRRHFYFMALSDGEVIDATRRGNLSRFLNHSCEPNIKTEKWTVDGELCIGLFALRDIQAGEELTFDYQFQRDGEKALPCHCGAPSCKGVLGGKGIDDDDAQAQSSEAAASYDPSAEPVPVLRELSEKEEDSLGFRARPPSSGGRGDGSAREQERRRRDDERRAAEALRLRKQQRKPRSELQCDLARSVDESGIIKRGQEREVVRLLKSQYSRIEQGLVMDAILRTLNASGKEARATKEAMVGEAHVLRAVQQLILHYRIQANFISCRGLLKKVLSLVLGLPLNPRDVKRTKTATEDLRQTLLKLSVQSQDASLATEAGRVSCKCMPEEYMQLVLWRNEYLPKIMAVLRRSGNAGGPGSRESLNASSFVATEERSLLACKQTAKDSLQDALNRLLTRRGTEQGVLEIARMYGMSNLVSAVEERQREREREREARVAADAKRRLEDELARWREDYVYHIESLAPGLSLVREQALLDKGECTAKQCFASALGRSLTEQNAGEVASIADRHGLMDVVAKARGVQRAQAEREAQQREREREEREREDARRREREREEQRQAPHAHGWRGNSRGGGGAGAPDPKRLRPHDPPHPHLHSAAAAGAGGVGGGGHVPPPGGLQARVDFKGVQDGYMWKTPSEDFKSVVFQIISYRVRRASLQYKKKIAKDEAKLAFTSGKLYNRVIGKELKHFDTKPQYFVLHSDLVRKVDHYVRDHLKKM